MPKETGIIMSGDHPIKCLDGTKTMTRRTWGLEKINKDPDAWVFVESTHTQQGYRHIFNNFKTQDTAFIKCPYGGVRDWLWMRETWMPFANPTTQYVIYKADNPNYAEEHQGEHFKLAWRPSIFMPREYSRGLFEILPGHRPERLQEITAEDCRAEGIVFAELATGTDNLDDLLALIARAEFASLWDSLNAKRGYPWDGNWWVWRIPYKEVNYGN